MYESERMPRRIPALAESPENYVIPPPKPTTPEEAESLYREFQRILLQTTVREAVRFCTLALSSGEAVTLVRETLAMTLGELELTYAASAEAAGHSISTHRRSLRDEYAQSNFLLYSVWNVLDSAGEAGLGMEALHQALLRRHRNLTWDRLKEILPHYCRKKLVALRDGRYYNVIVSLRDVEMVERLQELLPSMFRIMDGIRVLEPAAHIGALSLMCSEDRLIALRQRLAECMQNWMQEQTQTAPDPGQELFRVVILSGRVSE